MRYVRSSVSVDHDACGVGFIAQLGSRGSHEIVERGIEALLRLSHRGGVDADGRSGDGAGLLTEVPDAFFRSRAARLGIDLPSVFGIGMAFMPAGREAEARAAIEACAPRAGARCLGWRVVPTDASIIGERAAATLPSIEQCFFAPAADSRDFEGALFRLRKLLESELAGAAYFCSLSSRTIVYKGLLTPEQLPVFYPDLARRDFESSFAIFHQRYSTNTQPSWSLAQPFRFLAHNGEINTVRGNRRWFRAREPEMLRGFELGGAGLLEQRVSDSASLDNAVEACVREGYSPAMAMLRLVPPAWENDPHLAPELRHFLEVHARLQEPWDGPAALVFSDGELVGAKLDRNGLRPLRYTVTSDGLVVVGSEVGIADLGRKQIIERQRLGPGEMLLVHPATGTLIRPGEVPGSHPIARSTGHAATVRIEPSEGATLPSCQDPKRAMAALGWTDDQFRLLFQPLVESGQDAVWSMGDDAPPAFLSAQRRSLWDYCKQRFAQVTNPPIDPLRETHVMSLDVYCGSAVVLPSPLIDAGQVEALAAHLGAPAKIDFTFSANGGPTAAREAIERVRIEASDAVRQGAPFVLLSDRALSAEQAAVPALLALAAAWRAMVECGGHRVPLAIETGEVLDTHHVALLVASGASAVLPYLAFEQAAALHPEGAQHFRGGVEKGLRKVLARMGCSTIASYRNSQLFETIGLDDAVCAEFFEDADAQLGGKSFDALIADYLDRHHAAFHADSAQLRDAGFYRFRQQGEQHASSPELVRRLHKLVKAPTDDAARAVSQLAEQRQSVAIRDLLEVTPRDPVPLHEVETEASLLSRFSTQAMSLGAISPEAHRTLAIAMNRLGGRSNTGEGGEDPDIYRNHPEASNRVKQVASGRFGVTTEYLVSADEIEIKMAQGSKPGEGGQLPATKVTPYIARLRHAVPNMMLISPPPHHDIYSIEDLAQLIYDLRSVNPHARIGVKLVSGAGVGIIAAGVAKAGADVITISGHDGGTGASPISSIKNTGLPWEVGLRDAHRVLVQSGLRGRVRLRVDGGLKFARDIVIGALLGAEEFGFGTASLLAIGCVMARQCHLNTCPVGIATQDEKLRARFTGSPEMVEHYFRAVAREVRELLASVGAHSIDDIVGAVERVRPRTEDAERVVSELLERSSHPPRQLPRAREPQRGLPTELNRTLDEFESFVERPHRFRITSSDHAIGAHLSGEMVRRLAQGARIPAMEYEFVGNAGQSFGAFLVGGLKFRLLGEANDYVGKGLSGGLVAISAGEVASGRGDVLAGNTVLYGATGGELYIAGRAGERFAVRNSGALAVVEGIGQHGCEYMTAGVALVLGSAGANFGAGMTGGLAYVLQDALSPDACNPQSVRMVAIDVMEQVALRRVLRRHLQLTGSAHAQRLLAGNERLPLARVEPLRRPCSIAQTWAPILSALQRSQQPAPADQYQPSTEAGTVIVPERRRSLRQAPGRA